jgi:ASC-1-like (ASCH) protein
MDHIAFMQKAWGLTEKIATGQKTIESRWYNVKYPPWGRISPGDMVYFKDSGEPIRLRAQVAKIHMYENLAPQQVQALLEEYGAACGIEAGQLPDYYARFQYKRYAIFIFLKHPQRIAPFDINKAGFGKKASWICVGNVESLRVY